MSGPDLAARCNYDEFVPAKFEPWLNFAAFQPYVDREVEIIDPEVIVTLGRFSGAYISPR